MVGYGTVSIDVSGAELGGKVRLLADNTHPNYPTPFKPTVTNVTVTGGTIVPLELPEDIPGQIFQVQNAYTYHGVRQMYVVLGRG